MPFPLGGEEGPEELRNARTTPRAVGLPSGRQRLEWGLPPHPVLLPLVPGTLLYLGHLQYPQLRLLSEA